MSKLGRVFSIALILVFSKNVQAKPFANQFVEFELPNDWTCLLESSEWVCQNQSDAAKKKEAIIVLAAKMQGDQDTLDQYLNYLKNPKVYTTPQGKAVTSEVKYARTQTILDHPWVDALHLESEIPGFLTRYLATVKDGIGVLVTYSVNKNKFQDYSSMFEAMVKSLKVFRKEGGLNANGLGGAASNLFSNTKIPAGMSNSTFNIPTAGDPNQTQKKAKFFDDPMMLYGAIGIGVIVLLAVMKKFKKS